MPGHAYGPSGSITTTHAPLLLQAAAAGRTTAHTGLCPAPTLSSSRLPGKGQGAESRDVGGNARIHPTYFVLCLSRRLPQYPAVF